MNKSFVKLLQSFAGVALLSMASFSMAATYDYDFDADEDERGGQPLNFGDLNVYGYKNGSGANAYLDSGYLAGLGVCGTLSSQSQTGTNNKCAPGSDDNLQVTEVLKFVFDASKGIANVGINGPHKHANGEWVRIWSDTQGWDMLQIAADKITLGFYLTTLKVFGQGTFSDGQNDYRGSSTDLYVAGINEVPIPAAAWLFGSALLGLTGLRRRKVAA
ncbi:MAG: VPLPA-CTERM sorting domain-containing protein [Porticoccaceae bacterium]|nr:VPLPA-CTERM sorting domain-containing protein [Porticoccaceae bacterium]